MSIGGKVSHRSDLAALGAYGNHMATVLERLLLCEERRQELRDSGLAGTALHRRLAAEMGVSA